MAYHSAVSTVDFISADVDESLNPGLVRSVDKDMSSIDIGPCEVERIPERQTCRT